MLSIENQLPDVFVERIQKILTSDHYDQYLTSFVTEKKTAFRVNTLKITIAELIDRLNCVGIYPIPISWCHEGFVISNDLRRALTQTMEFREGFLYIQNLSSMFASLILDPKPGEEVLDLAAAPGGKTLHLAALMNNTGRIAAVEPVRDRFFRLKANVKLAGTTIVQTYCKDGMAIGRIVPERFDRVLLDAPCSSEARFDLQQPDSFKFWSEKKIGEMSRKQKRLIYSAIQALKPNGILVYCTCSFAPEENEAIIQHAINKFPNTLEILPIDVPFQNYQSGLAHFRKQSFAPELQKAIRIIPNEIMNGFFVCKLRKRG